METMTSTLDHLPEPVQRCLAGARAKGVEVQATMFETELPTAKAAAAQLGVTPAHITNSLIFEIKANGRKLPILVCAPGDRRVDTKKLAAALGVSKNKIKSASAASVLAVTGFAAGGVGPVGFLMPVHAAFVEERCFLHDFVYCGAGVKKGMLRCTPGDLLFVTGGVRVDLGEDEERGPQSSPSVIKNTEHGNSGGGYGCGGKSAASSPSAAITSTEVAPPSTVLSGDASFLPADVTGEEAGSDSRKLNNQVNAFHHDAPVPLEEQLSGVGDGSLRWFPERAFDFCGAFYQKNPEGSRIEESGGSKPREGEGLKGVLAPERLLPTVVIEQDPGHVGGIVWDAEVVLAHHLADVFAPTNPSSSGLRGSTAGGGDCGGGNNDDSTAAAGLSLPPPPLAPGEGGTKSFPLAGKRVIELGAGTGLSGLVCGLLGAQEVVLTELPEALPLLQRNADRTLPLPQGAMFGAAPTQGGGCYVTVCALPWGEEGFATIRQLKQGDGTHAHDKQGGNIPFDLVLIADCVYLPELYEDLAATVRALSGPDTKVLVAFEQRRRDISSFFTQFDQQQGGGGDDQAGGVIGVVDFLQRCEEEERWEPVHSSEHWPGSDGRKPKPGGQDKQNQGGGANESNCSGSAVGGRTNDRRGLAGKVTWLNSPLLQKGRDLAKVHLASVGFS